MVVASRLCPQWGCRVDWSQNQQPPALLTADVGTDRGDRAAEVPAETHDLRRSEDGPSRRPGASPSPAEYPPDEAQLRRPRSVARARIPVWIGGALTRPGLDDRDDILYVGKASRQRQRQRQRLRQHAATKRPASRLHHEYDLVRRVGWELTDDEEPACWREEELIFALRPSYNANPAAPEADPVREGARVPYLIVAETGPATLRFTPRPRRASTGRACGCFPHLGKGREPYAGHGPGAAGSPAARRGGHPPEYMRPTPRRDKDAALKFFATGPRPAHARRLLITGGHAGFGRPIVIGVLRNTDSDSPCSRLRADQGYIPRTGDGFA